MHGIDYARVSCIEGGTLLSVLYGDLDGRKIQKGGGICVHMWLIHFDCAWTVKTSMVLWSNYTRLSKEEKEWKYGREKQIQHLQETLLMSWLGTESRAMG